MPQPPLVGAGVTNFAIDLLLGALALFVAARYVTYRDDFRSNGFEHALVTALLGAVVWAILATIPLVGALLALVGWVAVLHWRYPGSLLRAGVTGAAAWAVAVVVLAAFELLGIRSLSALGVPGA